MPEFANTVDIHIEESRKIQKRQNFRHAIAKQHDVRSYHDFSIRLFMVHHIYGKGGYILGLFSKRLR